jgi:hypothetical protein
VDDKHTIRLTIDIEFEKKGYDHEAAESAVFTMGDEFMEELRYVGDEEFAVKQYETTAQRLDLAKAEARGYFVDAPVTVRTLLDVSTIHVDANAGFGEHRVQEHEHGWILFLSEHIENDPDWLKPIVLEARKINAMIINFDSDARIVEGWEEFE